MKIKNLFVQILFFLNVLLKFVSFCQHEICCQNTITNSNNRVSCFSHHLLENVANIVGFVDFQLLLPLTKQMLYCCKVFLVDPCVLPEFHAGKVNEILSRFLQISISKQFVMHSKAYCCPALTHRGFLHCCSEAISVKGENVALETREFCHLYVSRLSS